MKHKYRITIDFSTEKPLGDEAISDFEASEQWYESINYLLDETEIEGACALDDVTVTPIQVASDS